MNFNFFKKRKKSFPSSTNQNLPIQKDEAFDTDVIIYGSVIPYDQEDFAPFNEDAFAGESYEKSKKRSVSDPKTPPSFFLGFLLASGLVALICASTVLFAFFNRFGGIYAQIEIPNLTSLSEADAIKLLKSYGCFDYSIDYQENPSAQEGSVISQYPNPKAQRKLFSSSERITLKLTVNKKSNPVTLPSLVGQDARNVALELRNAGINVKVKEAFSSTVKIGKVISASHKKGSKISRGDTVTITRSLGEPVRYITVPDVLGTPESEAMSSLKKLGLEVADVTYKNSPYPAGLVIEQSLNVGESVRENSKISLTVSIGRSNGQ